MLKSTRCHVMSNLVTSFESGECNSLDLNSFDGITEVAVHYKGIVYPLRSEDPESEANLKKQGISAT